MKGRAIIYSAEERAWLAARSDWPRRELHRAFVEAFGRADVSDVHIKAYCKRQGWKMGRTGCFAKGNVPHNKGTHFCPPGSEKGWFRKGHRGGKAAKIYKPIGTERISKDGYVERKINDDMPFQRRWRAVHLIRWEEVNGPVPKGHALKCLDGNRANTDPANWIAVPRALLPRLAGRWSVPFDQAPDELKPTILAAARLQHKAKQVRSSGARGKQG